MTETLPLAVTALLPVILYPIFGILDAHEVSVVYLSVSKKQCVWVKTLKMFLNKQFRSSS